MVVDELKLKRQLEGVNKWKKASAFGSFKNGIGTLVYPTGFGKTYTTLILCKAVLDSGIKHEHRYTFHITVPSIDLKNQWEEEVENYFDKETLDKHFHVRVINTVMNELARISAYVSILDEIHEYCTDERIDLLDGKIVISKFKLGLTATYHDVKEIRLILNKYCPMVDYVTEKEAIQYGWTSTFVEYNLGIDFTVDERKKYDYYSDSISQLMEYFDKDFDIGARCLTGGKDNNGYERRNVYWANKWAEFKGWKPNIDLTVPANKKINEEYNPYVVIQYAKSLMGFVRKRKDLVWTSSTKLDVVTKLVEKYQEYKIITFSQSVAFAEDLDEKLNSKVKEGISVVYHSSLPSRMLPSSKTGKLIKFGTKRLKDRALDLFKRSVATVICTASSLDRGFNDKSVNIAISSSGTSNPIQQKQRSGRAKRIENYDEKKKVMIVNVYFKNSVDESWLTKRQETSFNTPKEVENINEINYNPNDKD